MTAHKRGETGRVGGKGGDPETRRTSTTAGVTNHHHRAVSSVQMPHRRPTRSKLYILSPTLPDIQYPLSVTCKALTTMRYRFHRRDEHAGVLNPQLYRETQTVSDPYPVISSPKPTLHSSFFSPLPFTFFHSQPVRPP